MAIPDNYIDKITKEGDSRMISPAANMVRVNNENFEGSDLDEVLDEVSAAIDEAGSGGYAPPPGGIPATDLAPAVQNSLEKADSAYQKPASGIPASDIAPGVIPDVSGLATKAEVNTGLADKVDKVDGKSLMSDAEHTKLAGLPTNPVQSVTINGTNHTPTNGIVDLGNVQGQKGDKGDTGNVQVDGNGNVLIVNNLEDGGTGAALSAEMGKRLALTTGTYEQAWQRSKVITGLFSFIWDEMGFKKPIWHVGNSVFVDAAGGIVSAAQAANVPAVPTFTSNGSSISDNSSVAKNTQVTITPAANSVLYYRIGSSGDYTASLSAVTLTLTTAGSVVLSAYCVNTKGNSNTSTLNLTVEGTQVPTFAAKSGTTIDNNDVVSRGGYVVITGAVGGTLKYKVGSASSYTEVAGVGDTAPSAEVQITGATTIKAYNVVDGDDSDEITKNYTMAALAAPTLSPNDNTEFPAGGGTSTITATEGDGIRYTTDGSDPRTSNTATVVNALTASVAVSSAVTIKACAYDDYGKSAVVQATYSVETAKLKVTASAATTMTLTKTDDSTIELTIAQGDNEFAIDTALGGVTTFKSCAFGNKTLITKIDFGGITINNITELFRSCSALTECINLDVNGAATSAFRDCGNLVNAKISGTITDASDIFHMSSSRNASGSVDLTGVVAITNLNQAFYSFCIGGTIDLSNAVVTNTRLNATFRGCKANTFVIGSFDVPSSVSGQLTNPFLSTLIRTIKCTALTPPTMEADWLAQFKSEGGENANILIPAAAETAYKTASGWSTYKDDMTTY